MDQVVSHLVNLHLLRILWDHKIRDQGSLLNGGISYPIDNILYDTIYETSADPEVSLTGTIIFYMACRWCRVNFNSLNTKGRKTASSLGVNYTWKTEKLTTPSTIIFQRDFQVSCTIILFINCLELLWSDFQSRGNSTSSLQDAGMFYNLISLIMSFDHTFDRGKSGNYVLRQ